MKKAVVIGSGFGGLSSAVRLLAKGYEVRLLEGRDQLGGRAGAFDEQGFHFDAGPTVITAPYLISELFEMLGEDPSAYYELLAVDPFYRIVFPDGSVFDYVGDEERLIENIRKLSPGDVEGYRKLAVHAEKIFEVGYEQLAHKPFETVWDMLKVIPQMVRLENYRSVHSLVRKYIKDERLRQAFSFEPLLVGGNPVHITSIYLLIHWLERKWGVFFPRGGTTSLVKGLGALLEKKGAKIHLGEPATKIEVKDGKVVGVTTPKGRYDCDLVISNADPVTTYSKLIDLKNRKKHTDKALAKRTPSMSLFVAYFGTKKTYPELAHHTILMGPRYEGLLDEIFTQKTLAQDFSLYLHAPTRTDKSLAPEGHECFYVLSPVPNNLSGIDWSVEGEKYKNRIFDWLDQTHLPGLKENLVVEKFITPDYFEHELQSAHGSGFGLEPNFRQSAYFRFHNRSEDIEGLYFVGASTHPGAGVPGVLSSAKATDSLIPPAHPLSNRPAVTVAEVSEGARV